MWPGQPDEEEIWNAWYTTARAITEHGRAPGMLSAPAEPPAPLAPTREIPAVQVLRQVMATRQIEDAPSFRPDGLTPGSSRVSARADRRTPRGLDRGITGAGNHSVSSWID